MVESGEVLYSQFPALPRHLKRKSITQSSLSEVLHD